MSSTAPVTAFFVVRPRERERRSNYFVTLVRSLGLMMNKIMPNFGATKKMVATVALSCLGFRSGKYRAFCYQHVSSTDTAGRRSFTGCATL
jgi:hypothetical protein